MSQVIVLNGPPGVGKSTVAELLRAFVPSTVVVSGDELRSFAPINVRAQLGGGATYRAASALVAAYVRLGARRVIFEYVFLRRAHFAYFGEALAEHVAPRVFTLWAPLEVVSARESARVSRARMGHRLRDSYLEMSANLAEMGRIIAAESLSAELVARQVHELAPLD